MKKTIYILSILILILGSCKQKNSSTSIDKISKPLNESLNSSEFDTDTKTKEIGCDAFSKSMTDLIHVLKQDNYGVETRVKQEEHLWFKIYKKEFEAEKSISFHKSKFKTIFAKRKNKLERMDDNWYPSFSLTEICFKNKLTASENLIKISEIISSLDYINEKNYDYILQNGNRLIYVSCGAKIFEEYAFGYKKQIEEIIKNNKRQQGLQ